MRRLSAAALAGVLALSCAGPAMAQSAGDDQYSDPFAGQQTESGGERGPASEEPPSQPAPAPAPAAPAAPAASAVPSADTQRTALPYTGLPAGAVLAAGVLLLGLGLGLRRASGTD